MTLIKRRLDNLDIRELNQDNYDSASWAYRQAHVNGSKEALRWALDLLSFVETK